MRDAMERQLERDAAQGDIEAAQCLERQRRGAKLTTEEYLLRFVGERIYIEGARMNYVGVVTGMISGYDGVVEGVLLHPCHRIGSWGSQGIEDIYREVLPTSEELPHLVPLSAIQAMGLMPVHWGGL